MIDRKVRSLPNWQEVAYGNVKILDNDKLISDKFSVGEALISDTSKLIWPITLKYDLSLFAKRETDKWFQIKKYIWDFGNGKIIEELNPVMIQKFDKKWTYNVSLKLLEIDLTGKEIEKQVEDIKEISILNTVSVSEQKLSNGGIQVAFDATNLKDLWKIEWYFEDNTTTPIAKWEIFRPAKVFYWETLVGMRIVKDGEQSNTFDKVFVIAGNDESSISAEISAEQSLENDLSYTLSLKNIKSDFQDGFVEEFKWIIGDKEYTKKWDPLNLEASSGIKHEFSAYGKQDIKVILKDANGNTKEVNKQINITKILKLKNALTISNNGNPLESLRYEAKAHEYFINDLGSPTILKLDAREVRADGFMYSLSDADIVWDINGDGEKDKTGKIIDYEVNTPGNSVVNVEYIFRHRKIADDIVIIKEKIYIEAVKKEAILDLKIEPESLYVPTFVRFDASRSEVKDDDIIKFIYDYGDGFSEERDAINPGRQYLKEWEYVVKLKVITKKWKEYSTSKSLILKAKADIAQIGMSMKQAPIGQEIDFNSEGSEGQVMSYFWDFWDGTTSTSANPSHAYKKSWTYKVLLRIGYRNNNFLEDISEVNITEE